MILVVYERDTYKETLCRLIKPGDTVIEIGPHVGVTTKAIALKAGRVIAIDKSEQADDAFKSGKMPANIEFIKGDVRLFDTVEKVFKMIKQCDVVAIDMGGGRFPDTVLKVWSIWSGVFKPRDSVIRNRGVGEFLKRAKIADPEIEKAYSDKKDSGWLNDCGRKTPSQLKEGLDEMECWMVKKLGRR